MFDGDSTDLDFYVVVDGKVQVFIKGIDNDGAEDGNEWRGHHLLNEVKTGGTVSSLFAILSILSEDMDLPLPFSDPPPVPVQTSSDTESSTTLKINTEKSDEDTRSIDGSMDGDVTPSTERGKAGGFVKEGDFADRMERLKEENEVEAADTIDGDELNGQARQDRDDGVDADEMREKLERKEKRHKAREERKKQAKVLRSVHPNLIARALTNTTIAVIPANSFRNLSEKFPKAAAHMVQVILTRFQRVTFLTLQKYLGLSKELLEIEKRVNDVAGGGLPASLFPEDLVAATIWRLSHRCEDEESLDSPREYQHPLTDQPLFSSPLNQKPFETLGVDDARSFMTGELDERIRDAIFGCIAQLIGLTASKGKSEIPHEPSPSSHIGNTIERFYYSTRQRTSVASASTGTGTGSARMNPFFDDSASVNSSQAESMTDGDDEYLEAPDVQILFFKQGKTLVQEGERSPGLYFVVDGVLEASNGGGKGEFGGRGHKKGIFYIHPGGLAGYLAALTGNTSFVNIQAKSDVLVGLMPKAILDRYVEKYPNVLLCLAKRLVNQLSPLVFHIDVALEWGQVNAGQVLCCQGIYSSDLGEPSHSIFIVLTGRLRSIKELTHNKIGREQQPSLEIQGEYGQSESVGELEVLIDAPRSSTIHVL